MFVVVVVVVVVVVLSREQVYHSFYLTSSSSSVETNRNCLCLFLLPLFSPLLVLFGFSRMFFSPLIASSRVLVSLLCDQRHQEASSMKGFAEATRIVEPTGKSKAPDVAVLSRR